MITNYFVTVFSIQFMNSHFYRFKGVFLNTDNNEMCLILQLNGTHCIIFNLKYYFKYLQMKYFCDINQHKTYGKNRCTFMLYLCFLNCIGIYIYFISLQPNDHVFVNKY